MTWRLAALGSAALLCACSGGTDDRGIDVSIIGERLSLSDPNRRTLSPPDRVLAGAVAQGLVAIDANGQIEPALAESWIVTSDGLSTIFRMRVAEWPDGRAISGSDAARSLTESIAGDSRNALKPLLTSVEDVVGMTGRVVEIRLRSPRPNLLQLLAQPELAIRRDGIGLGHYRIVRRTLTQAQLVPQDMASTIKPARLRAERAALAVARFVAGDTDVTLGGTLADLPLAREAQVRAGRLRFDPVQGLFGLGIVGRQPLLRSADVRAALAMAIDRAALAAALGPPDWVAGDTILPLQLDSASVPASRGWSSVPLAQRRADARARIAQWRRANGTLPAIRVAMPTGPGMRLLFARLANDWRSIGIEAIAISDDDANVDIRLIDQVAPNASANWYLTRLSCAARLVCDAAGDTALEASRAAVTLAARSARIAEADRVLTARGSFIALGSPVRWSLVDPRLTGWRDNAMGVHPLHALRP